MNEKKLFNSDLSFVSSLMFNNKENPGQKNSETSIFSLSKDNKFFFDKKDEVNNPQKSSLENKESIFSNKIELPNKTTSLFTLENKNIFTLHISENKPLFDDKKLQIPFKISSNEKEQQIQPIIVNDQSEKKEEGKLIIDNVSETKSITIEAIDMPISSVKLDINYQNEDLIDDSVYCNKLSKTINAWKRELDEKYTFYLPYKQSIINNVSELESLKDSANTTAKLFNTIQSHVQESSSLLTQVSNEQQDLIKQLKLLDNQLNKYNIQQKENNKECTSCNKEIKKSLNQLTNFINNASVKINDIKNTSLQIKNNHLYKSIQPISLSKSNKSNEVNFISSINNKQSVNEVLNSIYKEIQSIQQMEQAITFKLHSV